MRSNRRQLDLDPRTRLLIVVVCGLLAFLVNGIGLVTLFILASLYLLALGIQKALPKFALAFAILFGLQGLISFYFPDVTVFAFVIFIAARFIPVLMAASALSALSPGELIAGLQRMHVPRSVIISLAVSLRFMPCISKEFLAIRDAMHLRGIALSSTNTLTHPIVTAECILVPLLIRSMKISDELASSAFTRGIDNPDSRTCLRQLHLGLADGIAILVTCAMGLTMVFSSI